jgi:hypothetical protein
MNPFPDYCLRGISDPACIDEEGAPTASLFQFNNNHRLDGFSEESINWMDDEGAVELLLHQKKEDATIQFKHGAAVLSRKEIDRISKGHWIRDRLTYERAVVEANTYHGNILLSYEIPKPRKRLICALLANAVEEIRPNPLLHKK